MRILYQIKRLLLRKGNLFWTIAFPIFLGGLFFAMFGNITKMEQFSEIPVGLVASQEKDSASAFIYSTFNLIINNAKMSDDVPIFSVTTYSDEEEASKALKNDEIAGYILPDSDYSLTVKKSEVQTSVIHVFLDQFKGNFKMLQTVAKEQPSCFFKFASHLLQQTNEQIQTIELKGIDKDVYSQYFYAALAMTCLIMSSLGVNIGVGLQADLSPLGARRNVCPTSKAKLILEDFIAVMLVSFFIITFVLLVYIFVYQRDFGNNLPYILLASYIGCFTGIAVGIAISIFVKGPVQKKEAFSTTFFMVSSFLGGLQWGNITYILEENCPIINRINPATLIVNAYQSLAVFGDKSQYLINIGTLLLIGCIFLLVSIFKLRRTRYASI